MKRILTLITIMVLSNFIAAQENLKKCITSKIVKEELINNIEYESMRKNLIKYQQEHKNTYDNKQPIITIPIGGSRPGR